MVPGSEMACVIGKFEAITAERKKTDTWHHEQTRFAQKAFAQGVNALTSIIQEMGDPFCKNSIDLLVLDIRNLADAAVIYIVHKNEKPGQDQYDTCVSERLVNWTKHIDDPIMRNNLSLFNRPAVREKSRVHQQIVSLKNDCSLFSRLYIASQICKGDLEFFAHKNQAYPPIMSQMVKLRIGTRSYTSKSKTYTNECTNPTVQVVIIDEAAVVNTL